MLDKRLLYDLNHVITSTAYTSKINQNLRELLKTEVSMKAFINKFLLYCFPQLIVLQIACCSALNAHLERSNSISIQSSHLFLDHWYDHTPEFWTLFQAIYHDFVESQHDLLWCHNLVTKLFVDIDDVICVV